MLARKFRFVVPANKFMAEISMEISERAEFKDFVQENRITKAKFRPRLQKLPFKNCALFYSSDETGTISQEILVANEEKPQLFEYSESCLFCRSNLCQMARILAKKVILLKMPFSPLGLLITKRGLGFSVHQKCLDYSEGFFMIQNFRIPIEITLDGYRLESIQKLAKRKSRCSYCGGAGACSTCFVQSCKRWYHLPCGLKNGCLLVDSSKSTYCSKHAREIESDPAVFTSADKALHCASRINCQIKLFPNRINPKKEESQKMTDEEEFRNGTTNPDFRVWKVVHVKPHLVCAIDTRAEGEKDPIVESTPAKRKRCRSLQNPAVNTKKSKAQKRFRLNVQMKPTINNAREDLLVAARSDGNTSPGEVTNVGTSLKLHDNDFESGFTENSQPNVSVNVEVDTEASTLKELEKKIKCLQQTLDEQTTKAALLESLNQNLQLELRAKNKLIDDVKKRLNVGEMF